MQTNRLLAQLSVILQLCLLLVIPGRMDASVWRGSTQRLRSSGDRKTRLGLQGLSVTMHGKSVASATIRARRVDQPCVGAYAEFMSVGPLGASVPDSTVRPLGSIVEPSRRRLRVTISTSERMALLTIDDILTGRADSRRVEAEYQISPYGDLRDLWDALQGAPRVLGPDPAGPPIVWYSPTSFSWITRSDTLVVEQTRDALFKVTIQARVR